MLNQGFRGSVRLGKLENPLIAIELQQGFRTRPHGDAGGNQPFVAFLDGLLASTRRTISAIISTSPSLGKGPISGAGRFARTKTRPGPEAVVASVVEILQQARVVAGGRAAG
jgi:hypothetical protein